MHGRVGDFIIGLHWIYIIVITIIPLLLLLLVRNSTSLGLRVSHITQIYSNSSTGKRVGLRQATILFVSGSKASDERIQATPSLSKWTRARTRRLRLSKITTALQVHFSLPKQIQVAKEVKDVVGVALW